VVNSLLDRIASVPIWDDRKELFGLTQRKIAKILDRIDKSAPDIDHRKQFARKVFSKLKRNEGLDRRQAQVVQYLAFRLGLVPPVPIPEDDFEPLNKYLLDKVREDGLSKEITKELNYVSRISEACGREHPYQIKHSDFNPVLTRFDRALSDKQILTGLTTSVSPFIKG